MAAYYYYLNDGSNGTYITGAKNSTEAFIQLFNNNYWNRLVKVVSVSDDSDVQVNHNYEQYIDE